MKKLTEETLTEVVGGFNKQKCFAGTVGGALSGAASLGKLGWAGAALGGLVGGGWSAYNSCR